MGDAQAFSVLRIRVKRIRVHITLHRGVPAGGAHILPHCGDAAADAACEALEKALLAKGLEPLYDDRDDRAGAKFATMDMIGLPWRITVGPRGLANGVVELTSRRSGESVELTPEAAVARIEEIYAPHR